MMRHQDFDGFKSNLVVPGLGVTPPMKIIGKIYISWGGEPPMKTKKALKHSLPDGLECCGFAREGVQAC